MNRRKKNILIIAIILATVFASIKLIADRTSNVLMDKPSGAYHSSTSIREAKKEKIWLKTYRPNRKVHYSSDKKDSIELEEIWIEKNKNDKRLFPVTANYENILCVHFKRLTNNNLHKFRLIETDPLELSEIGKAEHPDGIDRVRFLINEVQDTIRIEILERNPTDSLAWTTEKTIDTITITKKN
ncbi:hypothetical protein N9355_10545 [Crocinitomicaceae bacterium]|nr:hypothetical protein [Crocinitomicaceae bacterium]